MLRVPLSHKEVAGRGARKVVLSQIILSSRTQPPVRTCAARRSACRRVALACSLGLSTIAHPHFPKSSWVEVIPQRAPSRCARPWAIPARALAGFRALRAFSHLSAGPIEMLALSSVSVSAYLRAPAPMMQAKDSAMVTSSGSRRCRASRSPATLILNLADVDDSSMSRGLYDVPRGRARSRPRGDDGGYVVRSSSTHVLVAKRPVISELDQVLSTSNGMWVAASSSSLSSSARSSAPASLGRARGDLQAP